MKGVYAGREEANSCRMFSNRLIKEAKTRHQPINCHIFCLKNKEERTKASSVFCAWPEVLAAVEVCTECVVLITVKDQHCLNLGYLFV